MERAWATRACWICLEVGFNDGVAVLVLEFIGGEGKGNEGCAGLKDEGGDESR